MMLSLRVKQSSPEINAAGLLRRKLLAMTMVIPLHPRFERMWPGNDKQ